MPLYAPWLILIPAYLLLWPPATRRLALAGIAAGLALAAENGQIDARALGTLALLGASAWAVSRSKARRLASAAGDAKGAALAPHAAWLVPAGHAVFVLTAIGLALHLLPGFHNTRVIDAVRLDPQAVPFTLYLNFDKPLIAAWIMVVLAPPCLGKSAGATMRAALAAAALACALCLGLAWLLDYTHWAPHWPPEGAIWLLNNAVLVTLAEEAFFRGYVQQRLTRKFGAAAACIIAALLFGLAHWAGGPAMITLATMAGLCYGWAYRQGGLAAAVLAHLALNTAHFGLFVYPALAG
ncbi:CPBP family intramembrane glutamic endopeptidase [Pseudomonadota bacterium AL_CKDN230030165-1A_HGKHYDSX7]